MQVKSLARQPLIVKLYAVSSHPCDGHAQKTSPLRGRRHNLAESWGFPRRAARDAPSPRRSRSSDRKARALRPPGSNPCSDRKARALRPPGSNPCDGHAQKTSPLRGRRHNLAESWGFEPQMASLPYSLSRRAPSASRSALQSASFSIAQFPSLVYSNLDFILDLQNGIHRFLWDHLGHAFGRHPM